jgi:hypothetical protein
VRHRRDRRWNRIPRAKLNYYVDHPDEFGPEWMVSFSVVLVVENVFAKWF